MSKKLSDRQVARIHMLRALGFNQEEIAERERVCTQSVKRYLYKSKHRVEAGENPMGVFGEQVENLLEVRALPKRSIDDRASLSVEEVDDD